MWTAAASLDDINHEPSPRLIEVCLRAADTARQTQLHELAARARLPQQRTWVTQWPGEHYRLLTALCRNEEVSLAVEVGTWTGMGTLALAAGAQRVVTYDVVPWQDIPDSLFCDDDWVHIEQRLGDLSGDFFETQVEIFRQADLVFIDGPKDAVFEPQFVSRLLPALRPGTLLVFDDILFFSMLQFWRDLPLPKIDMTSWGHWSGTGIAEVPGGGVSERHKLTTLATSAD
jgi:predicted O-methyltransferase YrrM